MPLKLEITGGDISLKCEGTIELYAKRTETKNDTITATGQVVLTSDSTLQMKWFDGSGSLPTLFSFWTLIKSTYGGAGAAITADNNFIYPPYSGSELLTYGLTNDNKILRVVVDQAA